jgi:sulfoxide reductase catalytic subunit YedY
VKIEGMVEKLMTVDFDDLMKKMKLEERLYRHRCVEAWGMAVPWYGFPMKDFVEFCKPTSGAKYVEMKTIADKSNMPGIRANSFWPWPYTEGLTMEEAANELSFVVTGMYGKPVPKQNGAPLRLAVPWKYGFKSVKSIVSVKFTDKRPKTFWEETAPSEYGFWANVNPKVPHPRWSQADEEVLGAGKRVPTQLYNGYGEFVADLYKGKENEKLFM